MPGWSRLPVINPGAVADNAQVTAWPLTICQVLRGWDVDNGGTIAEVSSPKHLH
jgi:hypothetical protein